MEHFDVVVIGAGQAGLAAGYHLSRRGAKFIILDADARVGDVWRKRWDSLRLFTPARFDSLDGMRFPAPQSSFPTKDEMADYLEAYARKFQLPVRNGTRVTRLSRHRDGYLVEAGEKRFAAKQVVIAAGGYQQPRLPAFAGELSTGITQLHSSQYRNASQLRPGEVLIVGAGNSGAEIALELSRDRTVLLSGPDVGQVPFRGNSFLGVFVFTQLLLRVVFHRLLTVRTLFGRKARGGGHARGVPLIRTRISDLLKAGVRRVARVTGTSAGKPLLEDGSALNVANVIWCTGYSAAFSRIASAITARSRAAAVEESDVPAYVH